MYCTVNALNDSQLALKFVLYLVAFCRVVFCVHRAGGKRSEGFHAEVVICLVLCCLPLCCTLYSFPLHCMVHCCVITVLQCWNFSGFFLHSDEFCCIVLYLLCCIALQCLAVYCTVNALKDSQLA